MKKFLMLFVAAVLAFSPYLIEKGFADNLRNDNAGQTIQQFSPTPTYSRSKTPGTNSFAVYSTVYSGQALSQVQFNCYWTTGAGNANAYQAAVPVKVKTASSLTGAWTTASRTMDSGTLGVGRRGIAKIRMDVYSSVRNVSCDFMGQ